MEEYKVLIADDKKEIREVAREMITRLSERIGFKASVSLVSSREGLESACDKNIDLVLTDVDMGNENDGFLATAFLRKKYPDLAIGIMSGHASEREAIEAGADYFVEKPFRLAELQEKILVPFYESRK